MGITEAKQRFGAPRFIDEVKEHSVGEEEIKLFQTIEAARANYLLLRLTQPDYQDPEFVAFLSKERATDFLVARGLVDFVQIVDNEFEKIPSVSTNKRFHKVIKFELVDNACVPKIDDPDNLKMVVDYGREAMNEVIRENQKLADRIAGKYFKYCHEFKIPSTDILGQAREGLAEAVVKFNYRKKTKFSTYAFIFIRGRIIGFLRDVVCSADWDKIRGHERSFNRIAQKLGHTPVKKDFPDGKEQEVYDFVKQVNLFFHPAQIDSPINQGGLFDGDEGDSLSSFFPDPAVNVSEAAIKLIMRKGLRAIFSAQLRGEEVVPDLTKREIIALYLRHGFDQGGDERALEEVGKKLGLSHTAVGNILKEAYGKLRRSEELKELFELAF